MKHLAVFDWNGTIFDDFEACYEGANVALDFLGHKPISRETYLDTFTFPIIHFYAKNGVDVDSYLFKAEEMNMAFLNSYEQLALNCGLRPGAIRFIEALRARGVYCMILSNYLQEYLEAWLDRFGIAHLFDHVSANTSHEAIVGKMTKQERLNGFLETRHFDPADCFIIGDSLEEPEIARHLGMAGFSITGGCISRERLEAHGAPHLVDHFDEVADILESLWFGGQNAKQQRVI